MLALMVERSRKLQQGQAELALCVAAAERRVGDVC